MPTSFNPQADSRTNAAPLHPKAPGVNVLADAADLSDALLNYRAATGNDHEVIAFYVTHHVDIFNSAIPQT